MPDCIAQHYALAWHPRGLARQGRAFPRKHIPRPSSCYAKRRLCLQVSNKVVELLMLRQGCDVCCVGDAGALQRYEEALRAEGSLN